MKKIGSYMVLAGLFAIVLNFMDRVPRLLVWIYNWGDTTAWIIKIGLIIVGAILYIMGAKDSDDEVVDETETIES